MVGVFSSGVQRYRDYKILLPGAEVTMIDSKYMCRQVVWSYFWFILIALCFTFRNERETDGGGARPVNAAMLINVGVLAAELQFN